MNILVFILAIGLSMDAFSLSLAYSMSGLNKKQILKISLSVGMFHFFMPLFGFFLGTLIFEKIIFNYDFFVFLILFFIGFQMFFDDDKEINALRNIEIIFFALAVSIDSFAVGITLLDISNHYIFTSLTFALISFFFTFLGLNIGNKVYSKLGKIAKIIGGISLIAISFFYLF